MPSPTRVAACSEKPCAFVTGGGAAKELESDPANDSAWTTANAALAEYGVSPEDDAELSTVVANRDADGFRAIIEGWQSSDRVILKRAMKAYRKSLKVTILDAESSLGDGPMSSGRKSTITGIMPPRRYPIEVWDHLVHQDRLAGGARGIYELPPGG